MARLFHTTGAGQHVYLSLVCVCVCVDLFLEFAQVLGDKADAVAGGTRLI